LADEKRLLERSPENGAEYEEEKAMREASTPEGVIRRSKDE